MGINAYTLKYTSPVGILTVASDGENITGLWIEDQKYFGAALGDGTLEKELPVLAEARKWLDIYFIGKEPDFMPRLSAKGSAFREAVWAILCDVPYGEVTTYGKIAQQLEKASGKRVSAQAVGGAVGHNPISILIPCHRVVGTNGSLTGYAGGIGIKVRLLKLEGVPMDNLFIPKKGTAL